MVVIKGTVMIPVMNMPAYCPLQVVPDTFSNVARLLRRGQTGTIVAAYWTWIATYL